MPDEPALLEVGRVGRAHGLRGEVHVVAVSNVDDFVKAYRVPEKYKGFRADPQQVAANAKAIWEESKK